MTSQPEQIIEKLSRTSRRWRFIFVTSALALLFSVIVSLFVVQDMIDQERDFARQKEEEARQALADKQLVESENKLLQSQIAELQALLDELRNSGAGSRELERAQAVLDRIKGDIGGLSVGFFYCEANSEASRELAERSAQAKPATSNGVWTARILTDETNKTRPYRLNANVIRYEDGEREFASTLRSELERILDVEIGISRRGSVQPSTENYVSVFFCDGALG